MATVLLLYILTLGLIKAVQCETSSAVPETLYECFRADTDLTANPPWTMPLLIELIRKVELDPRNALNIKHLTTSMLHGIIKDGIKRSLDADSSVLIPYRASGTEFYKYKMVVDFLTGGQGEQFPSDSLDGAELCFLHRMLSNTADGEVRGDEAVTCKFKTNLPLELEEDKAEGSLCPVKYGVVKTKWGPVAAGHIVAAIASTLEKNEAAFGRIIESSKGKIKFSEKIGRVRADNVWVSTVAGDVAEVVFNQHNLNPVIGVGGVWNDTNLPTAFYLNSGQSDLTEAEILGSVDALILASNLKDWLDSWSSLRLSQLLDMYYSDRGIPFDARFKANNRSTTLDYLLSQINLEDQIHGAVYLLKSIGAQFSHTLTDEDIAKLVNVTAAKFRQIARNVTNKYDNVEDINLNDAVSAIEIIVILDNSFDAHTAQQVLYLLAEAVQVSYYGSSLGVINGQTGNWMTNVSHQIFPIFTGLEETREWPALLNLGTSLKTITSYYQNKSDANCMNRVKPLAQAILVFSRDGRLSDSDRASSEHAIRSIKSSYPETNIVYISESNTFEELMRGYENDSFIPLSPDVTTLVKQITNRISYLPGSIIKYYCNHSDVRFEDYVTPGIDRVFEVNQEYTKRGEYIAKFKNYDYGDLMVCVQGGQGNCQGLPKNEEVKFSSLSSCRTPCNLQFVVSSRGSAVKCTENDCRYPDQIRFDITYGYSSGVVPRTSLGLAVACLIFKLLE